MNEEQLEAFTQSFPIEDGSLYDFELGLHTVDQSKFADITPEHERKLVSKFLFKLPKEWRQSRGAGVRVAILDSGIEKSHSDLIGNIIETKDFTNQGLDHSCEHGILCAGIIAAKSTGTGLTGIAPECELLVGKVIDTDRYASCKNIAEGIDWAVDSGAHIISIALRIPSSSPLLYRSIYYALAKGVHIICSTGHISDLENFSTEYPARYGGPITVASCDYSNISTSISGVDIMLPNPQAWSTYTQNSYCQLKGPSVAMSLVTGIAARIVSCCNSMPNGAAPIFNCEDLLTQLQKIPFSRQVENNIDST